MKFQPKTEKEIEEMNLWPAGEYAFEILAEATLGSNHYMTCDKISKSGNEMIQLVVKVFSADSGFRIIIDYLLESMPFKLRHAAHACNLLPQYQDGLLEANDFIGKQGYLKLKIDKDKTGQYADKNAIADYVPDDNAPPLPKAKKEKVEDFISDEIPF